MRSHSKILVVTTALAALMAVPAAAQAAEAVAVNSGTMRAGPDTEFPSVDHISSGDELEVYGCTDGYDWCDVSDGDNRGWFPGSRIAFVRDGRREVVTEYGAAIGIGIIGFGIGEYWGAHYHNRPFYGRQNFYANRWHGPQPGNHPPRVNNPPPHVNNPPPNQHFNNNNNNNHHFNPQNNQQHVNPQHNVQPHVNNAPHVQQQPHVNVPHNQAPHVNVPHNAPHAPPPIENHKPL